MNENGANFPAWTKLLANLLLLLWIFFLFYMCRFLIETVFFYANLFCLTSEIRTKYGQAMITVERLLYSSNEFDIQISSSLRYYVCTNRPRSSNICRGAISSEANLKV